MSGFAKALKPESASAVTPNSSQAALTSDLQDESDFLVTPLNRKKKFRFKKGFVLSAAITLSGSIFACFLSTVKGFKVFFVAALYSPIFIVCGCMAFITFLIKGTLSYYEFLDSLTPTEKARYFSGQNYYSKYIKFDTNGGELFVENNLSAPISNQKVYFDDGMKEHEMIRIPTRINDQLKCQTCNKQCNAIKAFKNTDVEAAFKRLNDKRNYEETKTLETEKLILGIEAIRLLFKDDYSRYKCKN